MGRREDTELDRELAVLPPELRWREWMRRIEAVLFASTTPVAREDLARVVGQGASVDLLIEDLAVDLELIPDDLLSLDGESPPIIGDLPSSSYYSLRRA